MYKSEIIDYSKIRKKAANLFFGVLTNKISIREALLQFPKDCEDKTIIAAWHALCHLEADEDIRKKDAEYKKVQDKYIEYIAFTLRDGNSLPENIIKEYLPYHSEVLTPNSKTIKGIIYKFKKFLNC